MAKKNRKCDDKIFDNKYNRGEIETHQLKDIKPDAFFESTYMTDSKNAIETYFDERLYELLYSCWSVSEWADDDFYTTKRKINKDSLSQIYTYFKLNINDSIYTNTELFCAIAEFLNQNYYILYEMISTKYKIEILKEIEEKYPKYFKNDFFPLF